MASPLSMLLSYLREAFHLDISPHPPPEIAKLRREITETYGYIAILLSLALLLLFPLWLATSRSWTLKRAINTLRPRKLLSRYPRLAAAASNAATATSAAVSRYQLISIVLFWAILNFYLCWADNHSDFLFVAKRLGRISVSMLPALFCLTLKPSPLPLTLYLWLVPLHKWLARIVVVEAVAHTGMYLYYFAVLGTLAKLGKWANIAGVVAMVLFVLIAATSVAAARRASYRIFYYVHYIATWLSLACLAVHARPGAPWALGGSAALLAGQLVYRYIHTHSVPVTVESLTASLDVVQLPREAFGPYFTPASHIRVVNPGGGRWLSAVKLSHPYTLASLASERETVKLVVRRGRFRLKSGQKYYVFGPLSSKLTTSFLGPRIGRSFFSYANLKQSRIRKVLLVCGGSSISFAIPLIRLLEYNGIPYKLVWTVRDINEAKVLQYFGLTSNVELYVTGGPYLAGSSVGSTVSSVADSPAVGASSSAGQSLETVPLLSSLKMPVGFMGYTSDKPLSGRSAEPETTPTGFPLDDESQLDVRVDMTCQMDRPGGAAFPGSVSSFESLIPPGVDVFYSRPVLGCRLYDWFNNFGCCQNQPAGGVCCRTVGGASDSECGGQRAAQAAQADGGSLPEGNWVIASGPAGLVKHTKEWSIQSGFNFYEELYSI